MVLINWANQPCFLRYTYRNSSSMIRDVPGETDFYFRLFHHWLVLYPVIWHWALCVVYFSRAWLSHQTTQLNVFLHWYINSSAFPECSRDAKTVPTCSNLVLLWHFRGQQQHRASSGSVTSSHLCWLTQACWAVTAGSTHHMPGHGPESTRVCIQLINKHKLRHFHL